MHGNVLQHISIFCNIFSLVPWMAAFWQYMLLCCNFICTQCKSAFGSNNKAVIWYNCQILLLHSARIVSINYSKLNTFSKVAQKLHTFAKLLKIACICKIAQNCTPLQNCSKLHAFAKLLKIARICKITQRIVPMVPLDYRTPDCNVTAAGYNCNGNKRTV